MTFGWRSMERAQNKKVAERLGKRVAKEVERERDKALTKNKRRERLVKGMAATRRRGLRVELLVPSDRKVFDCADLPHHALALARLDVRVQVDDGSGAVALKGGRVLRDVVEGNMQAKGPGAKPGGVVTFWAHGEDAEEAIEIIREVFAEGRVTHLSVLKLHHRYEKTKDPKERLSILEEYEALRWPGGRRRRGPRRSFAGGESRAERWLR